LFLSRVIDVDGPEIISFLGYTPLDNAVFSVVVERITFYLDQKIAKPYWVSQNPS
jgi:hypothetical protein